MIFVGDDWAEDHHDIHVMDAGGTRLASRRLPEGLAGIAGFHELMGTHAEEPSQVVIGIETDRGLWVQALGAAFTAAVVLATLWLLGAVGWSAELVGLEHRWLKSPIGLGA